MSGVPFPVPVERALAYLADPRNRPAWQSSLRRVEDVRGEVGVGQTWVDVTTPGLKPRMETTEYEPPIDGGPARWSERGTWRDFSAELTLVFEPTPGGCVVTPTFVVRGPGAFLLNLLAPGAVRGDLRRASRLA